MKAANVLITETGFCQISHTGQRNLYLPHNCKPLVVSGKKNTLGMMHWAESFWHICCAFPLSQQQQQLRKTAQRRFCRKAEHCPDSPEEIYFSDGQGSERWMAGHTSAPRCFAAWSSLILTAPDRGSRTDKRLYFWAAEMRTYNSIYQFKGL